MIGEQSLRETEPYWPEPGGFVVYPSCLNTVGRGNAVAFGARLYNIGLRTTRDVTDRSAKRITPSSR
ncbi:MAG: hypothetical protein NVS4B8_11920 [Herpetosiphon sp.]